MNNELKSNKRKPGILLSFFILFVLLFTLLFIPSFVSASPGIVSPRTNIGVTPGVVNINNILAGGYYKGFFVLSSSSASSSPLVVAIRKSGEGSSWLSFPSPLINLSTGYIRVPFEIKPPDDVVGNYTVLVDFLAYPLIRVKGRARVVSGVTARVQFTVTKNAFISCDITDMNLRAERDRISVGFIMLNRGNVRVSPELSLDIWNSNQTRIVSSYRSALPETLPTLSRKYALNLSFNPSFPLHTGSQLPRGRLGSIYNHPLSLIPKEESFVALISVAPCNFLSIRRFRVNRSNKLSFNFSFLPFSSSCRGCRKGILASSTVTNNYTQRIRLLLVASVVSANNSPGEIQSAPVTLEPGESSKLSLFIPLLSGWNASLKSSPVINVKLVYEDYAGLVGVAGEKAVKGEYLARLAAGNPPASSGGALIKWVRWLLRAVLSALFIYLSYLLLLSINQRRSKRGRM